MGHDGVWDGPKAVEEGPKGVSDLSQGGLGPRLTGFMTTPDRQRGVSGLTSGPGDLFESQPD